MNLLSEIFCGEEKIFSRKVPVLHAALILTSVAFVWMFSHSTSPRYFFIGLDSSVFQVIGKYWAQGHLPYVELFDQKGPLIFLINALGYMITPRVGIMVPQIIFMYFSLLMLWRAIELVDSNGGKKFFFVLTIFYYAAHYWEGNNCGEYTMPFLALATFCFLKTLKISSGKNFIGGDEPKLSNGCKADQLDATSRCCPTIYGFIYGFGFGGCVLLRASNSMPICCYVFLTMIFLIHAHDFKTLRQNVLSFCAGFAVIVLPFVIYFAAHGALYDALYGTILFNVNYATRGKIEYGLDARLEYSILNLMPIYLMIVFGTVLLVRDLKNKLAWSSIFVGVMMSLLLMNLRLYFHYCMIVVSTMPLLFVVLKSSLKICRPILSAPHFSFKRLFMKIFVVSAATYALTCCLQYSVFMAKYFSTAYISAEKKLYDEEVRDIRRLQSLIPEDERNSFACWGNFYSTSHWILTADMKPNQRFFMNNSALVLLEPAQKYEWLQNVRDTSTLWILYGTNKTLKDKYDLDEHRADPDVEKFLAERYELRGEILIYDQVMKLYRLSD